MGQRARARAGRLALSCLALVLVAPGPAAADWATRESGGRIEAGTRIDGAFAGLLLRCGGPGRVELLLTHNGAVFDAGRSHTIVVSVDGTASVLSARARASGRPGDDDFVHEATMADLEPLLLALARGRSVELSAPSGRYVLELAGSGRAIEAFRSRCPAA